MLLDNASIHNTVLVKQTIADKGYVVLFVPPYSPEFNPIELVFGVIKNSFYRLRYSDSFADLLQLQQHALAGVSSNNACSHGVNHNILNRVQ